MKHELTTSSILNFKDLYLEKMPTQQVMDI